MPTGIGPWTASLEYCHELCANDIDTQNEKAIAYADDLVLLIQAPSSIQLQTRFRIIVPTLTSWTKRVKLGFAPEKTKAVLFK